MTDLKMKTVDKETTLRPMKYIRGTNRLHSVKAETKEQTYIRQAKPKAMPKTLYVVAGVYNDGDGSCELVSNALWYPTLDEAKKRAEEWARDLYDEWKCENFMRTLKDNMQEVQFEDVWEKVDNRDPEFMDWGFDPVEDWGVSSVRIRVFKVTRGK